MSVELEIYFLSLELPRGAPRNVTAPTLVVLREFAGNALPIGLGGVMYGRVAAGDVSGRGRVIRRGPAKSASVHYDLESFANSTSLVYDRPNC